MFLMFLSPPSLPGAPLAAALLALDGVCGIEGYKWLFLAEGVPTIALGLLLARRVPNGPADAKFLTPDERAAVAARTRTTATVVPFGDVEKGAAARKGEASAAATGVWPGVVAAAADRRTWHTAAVVALEAAAKNAIIYWSPLIIAGIVTGGGGGAGAAATLRTSIEAAAAPARRRSLLAAVAPHAAHPAVGAGAPIIALLSAAPFGVAAAAMWVCARRAKAAAPTAAAVARTHIALPFAVGAVALLIMAASIDTAPVLAFGALLAAAAGLWAPSGVVYSLPASFLAGPSAAAGIAVVNSIGNVGGALGPLVVGTLKAGGGGYGGGLALMALSAAAAAAVAAVFPAGGTGSAATHVAARAGGAGSRSGSSSDEGGAASPARGGRARR